MKTYYQFCDYLSEAVNKEGFHNNLIVYHGTSHKFDHFDDNHNQKNRHSTTPEREVRGHFFTPDIQSAGGYAGRSAKTTGNKPRIITAKLHMQNPYDATKDIKKHQKAGMTFSDAKNKVYSSVDRSKHDGVYHNGSNLNPSEYVAFHAKDIEQIKSPVNEELMNEVYYTDIASGTRTKMFISEGLNPFTRLWNDKENRFVKIA